MQIAQVPVLVAMGVLFSGSAGAIPTLSPFINELHYDNAGSDVGEFIEIAGSAQSLLGLNLVLYNGGTGRSYRSVPLEAEIPDQVSGFGAVAVFVAGLQNGPADGIALVDAMNRVLEWLSYEGQLLARDGPAMGLLSTPLDVFQPAGTARGLSLQRFGLGLSGVDFDWGGPLPSSPGLINTDQEFIAPTAIAEPAPLLLLSLGLVLVGISRHKPTRHRHCR